MVVVGVGFVCFVFFRHESQLGLHAGVHGPVPMYMLTQLTEISGFCLLVLMKSSWRKVGGSARSWWFWQELEGGGRSANDQNALNTCMGL